MESIDTLITARWVVPIEPDGCVLDDHAVAIDRGRIVAILPAQRARERFSPRETLDRPSHALLPGFVNTHARAAMTLLRGAAESGTFVDWLARQIRPLEQRWADPEYARDGTELAIADMLTSGTTCFADVHLFPEVSAQTASALRIRACVGLPVADTPTSWGGSVDEYLKKGLDLRDEYRDDPLITTALAPQLAEVSDSTLVRARRAADEVELPVIVRATPDSTATAQALLDRLEEVGLLSPLLTAVHPPKLSESQIERLARAGATIARCPRSSLKLGLGANPAAGLMALGVNVALGTDAAASGTDLSMLEEVRTAALLERGLFPAATANSAHDWLRSATLNGARAIGLNEVIGSLVAGKWADISCIDLGRPHTQPVYDPAAQIVFAASRDQVSDVWVAGRQLLQDRQLTHLDSDDVLRRAASWRDRIAGSLHS
jgi:5-methylthioadenosine/S-adenosylhomocysteine deaminase